MKFNNFHLFREGFTSLDVELMELVYQMYDEVMEDSGFTIEQLYALPQEDFDSMLSFIAQDIATRAADEFFLIHPEVITGIFTSDNYIFLFKYFLTEQIVQALDF